MLNKKPCKMRTITTNQTEVGESLFYTNKTTNGKDVKYSFHRLNQRLNITYTYKTMASYLAAIEKATE